MKIIIAGGRSFDDYNLLSKKCDAILINQKDIEIVSGHAKGADSLGEKYAIERNYGLKLFPADWTLGKKAGYIRNAEMAKYGDALIAFWDGKSKGTANMIKLAETNGLKIRVIRFDK